MIKILSLIATIILFGGMAVGQNKPTVVQEPEYIGVFMFLDVAKG